jgi:ribosomal protein S18 acetylase RimI-like enzyme
LLLRPATCHDLPALHAVERSATELYYEAGFSRAHVDPRSEADMRHLLKYTTVLVACEGDEPVAYASYYARGPFLHLEEIAVRRDRQRRGHGRALAGQVLQAAHDDPQCTHLSLVTFARAPWALGLYHSLGFAPLADDADLPHVELLHEIAALEATAPGEPRVVMVRAKPD